MGMKCPYADPESIYLPMLPHVILIMNDALQVFQHFKHRSSLARETIQKWSLSPCDDENAKMPRVTRLPYGNAVMLEKKGPAGLKLRIDKRHGCK